MVFWGVGILLFPSSMKKTKIKNKEDLAIQESGLGCGFVFGV